MKTFLLKVFLMLVAFAFGATMLSAQDFTYGDLEYSINYDDVTVTVTGISVGSPVLSLFRPRLKISAIRRSMVVMASMALWSILPTRITTRAITAMR